MNTYSFNRQLALTEKYVLPQPAPPPALAFVWRPHLFVKLLNSRGQFGQPRGSPSGIGLRLIDYMCGPPGGAGPPNRIPLFSN